MKLLVMFVTASLALSNGQFDNKIDDVSSLWISTYIQTYVQPVMEVLNEKILDSQCKRDLNFTYQNLMENKMWSYQMFDAWAKPQTGILTGNIMHTGNYDECLAINEVINETRIQGQYCTVFVIPNKEVLKYVTNVLHGLEINEEKSYGELVTRFDSMKASWGLCVPASCTLKDLRQIWISIQDHFELWVDVYFDDNFCEFEGKRPPSAFAIFTIAFLCTFGIIIIVSALYDIKIHQKRNGAEPNLIVAFSAYTNAKKIFSSNISDNCLSCLNGMRVISMIWIITIHRLVFNYYRPHINSNAYSEWPTKAETMVFVSGTLAVDTFFLISGLLISYLFLQNKEKGGGFNLPLFYLHRLLRLTPSLAVLVLVFASLISYLGSGPFWYIAYDILQKSCESNWWATLFYIQNYAYPEGHCIGHAWYLAVDTQLYFLSPLILIPLAKWPRKTLVAVSLLASGSLVWVFVHTWTHKLGSTYLDETMDYHKYYVSTHLRAAPWLIGIVMGYVIHKTRKIPFKINTGTVMSAWILSLSVMLGVIFGHLWFTRNEYDVLKSSFFNSLSHLGWALGVSWIIFACANGYGGFINEFLSLPIFNVLIKLNYSMYLLHIIPIAYFAVQVRTSIYFNPVLEVYSVWSDVAATLILALPWTLAFESPIIMIERIIFKKR